MSRSISRYAAPMRRQRFGSLDALVADARPAPGPGPAGGAGPVCVLMHGFGAPGDDLAPLADELAVPDWRWVFPAAPLELGGLYGDARAWWHLDLARLERELAHGPTDRAAEIPPGLADARAQVIAALDAIALAMPGAPIVLGGFSQGAMLALDVALHDPRPLAGLILLSGTFIAESEWGPRFASRAGLRVLQSHGRRDGLLPFAAAERLRARMTAAGLEVRWLPFDGAHEIPPSVLAAMTAFLAATR